jgi:MraZ protein
MRPPGRERLCPVEGVRILAAALFRSQAASALDSKGRFSLPVKFRNVLALTCENPGTVLLRADPKRPYLSLFGDKLLEEFLVEIQHKSESANNRGESFDREQMESDFFGPIEDASIDSGGRFAVPAKMRKFYGIEDVLFMVGSGRMVRLWSPERFLAAPDENAMHKEECAQFLAELSDKKKARA